MTHPKLAGGARPRAALVAATGESRVRVTLTPPGGEPLSVWATVAGGTVTTDADVPGVAAGWAVAGRGLTGTVAAADGRTLTVPAPEQPASQVAADAAPAKPRRVREVQP